MRIFSTQTIAPQLANRSRSQDAAALFRAHGVVRWRGASGRTFAHTVYSLIGCPGVSAANYMLVLAEEDGTRRVLAMGRTATTVASENLAVIRQEAALRGANEVHLHLLGMTDADRAAIEFDLAAATDVAPSSEPPGRPN